MTACKHSSTLAFRALKFVQHVIILMDSHEPLSKFHSHVITSSTPSESSLTSSYHFFEKYDSQKPYGKDEFHHDFGHGTRRYTYSMITFGSGEKYVMVKEMLTQDEKDDLLHYCQCKSHYKQLLLGKCPCCKGEEYMCLGTHEPSQINIDIAKRNKQSLIFGPLLYCTSYVFLKLIGADREGIEKRNRKFKEWLKSETGDQSPVNPLLGLRPTI
jgi:hypothetical protein